MNTPQLPLALRSQKAFRLDDFIGNAELCALLAATARGNSRDSLFLHGPTDSGKTHLLLATMSVARANQRDVNYLPLRVLAQAAEDTLDAADGHALLCVDDVDAIAGHRAAEEALFRLHKRPRSGQHHPLQRQCRTTGTSAEPARPALASTAWPAFFVDAAG